MFNPNKQSFYLVKVAFSSLLIFMMQGITSCKAELEPIQFGKDQCHFCKMIISDPKFGAEFVTTKGKVYKFDAAECLANYWHKEKLDSTTLSLVAAIAFDNPGQLVQMNQLNFLVSPNIPSPMGGFLSAYQHKAKAEQMHAMHQGILYDWNTYLKEFPTLNSPVKFSTSN